MEEIAGDMISDAYSGIILNNEMFTEEPVFMKGDSDEDEVDDIIRLHMDLRQPLSFLRSILEQKIGVSLKNYEFWLQNAQVLESHKTLGDQCVKGEGIAQINVQVITLTRHINIVDVLKPSDDVLGALSDTTASVELTNEDSNENNDGTDNVQDIESAQYIEADEKQIIKWIADERFKSDQIRLGIPNNPFEWSLPMVQHWLQWAVRQFNLAHIKLQDWQINGKELCNLTLDDFQKKVPHDPGDIFWTHLELLRKCKMVAVLQKNNEIISNTTTNESNVSRRENQVFRKNLKASAKIMKQQQTVQKIEEILGAPISQTHYEYPCGNRTGNNGQIQLWQFLLEILTNRSCRNIIHWLDGNGEFKLKDPERVAQLWGERKNKPTMNYEKLSRALRYYYDGDMISKVHGKRFVYQFVCDLRQLIGYSAEELAKLVDETPVEIDPMGFNDHYILS